MDYTNPEVEFKTSKINSAALMNLILTDLWKDAHQHARKGRLRDFSNDLDCIWIHLGGDEDKESDASLEYIRIEKELTKIDIEKKQGGFSKDIDVDLKEKLTMFYRVLMEKALFLRRLQNKQGKGTAYQDPSDDYMD